MSVSTTETREKAFGQTRKSTLVDRFGIWLSSRQIQRYTGSFEGLRVGDFGCGYHAAFSRTIQQSCRSLTLVDVSLSNDVKALSPNVRAIEGALPQALEEISDGSLDVALCVSVIEHVSEPQKLINGIFRVLAPDGMALLNVPSWRGKRFLEFSAFQLGFSPAEEMNDHKMYYDVKDLWPLLVKTGFKPSDIRCFAHKFGLNTFAVCKKGI
jgi:2-polyprenyl-3-methyl-5-hydroxy-6-metoxy-1,4-benzoquinol methylase